MFRAKLNVFYGIAREISQNIKKFLSKSSCFILIKYCALLIKWNNNLDN